MIHYIHYDQKDYQDFDDANESCQLSQFLGVELKGSVKQVKTNCIWGNLGQKHKF